MYRFFKAIYLWSWQSSVALIYWARRLLRRLTGRSRTVLIYPPMHPDLDYTVRHACMHRGYRISSDPFQPADLAVYWEDGDIREPDASIIALAEQRRVLNFHSRDITKERVMTVFEEVFGYSFRIDPLTHEGKAFTKSNGNGLHDGAIIDCPVESVIPGNVYQRWIDNQVGPQLVEELRATVLNGSVCYVLQRLIPLERRVCGRSVSYKHVATESVFDPEEVEKIEEFARRMQLDICELDVARDRNNGRIYIMDANNTPTMPLSPRFSHKKRSSMKERLATAFDRSFF